MRVQVDGGMGSGTVVLLLCLQQLWVRRVSCARLLTVCDWQVWQLFDIRIRC